MQIAKHKLNKMQKLDLYKSLWLVAVPIVIQNLIGNSLVLIDTVMISQLGEAAVAAVGIAGKLQFMYILITFGCYSGASIFMAQYFGSKDYEKLRLTMAIQLILGFGAGAIFTMIALVFGREYMSIFSNDIEVIELGVKYLKYFGVGFVIHCFSYAYIVSLRSIRDAVYPMIVSIIAIVVNTSLNYVLIFGHFGFPELGVEGAAIATTISRVVETSLIVYSIWFGKRKILRNRPGDLSKLTWDYFKKYLKIASPVIINESLWGLGTVIFTIAYARLGTSALASAQVASTVYDIMLVFAFGLASSVGTILGNQLGQGNISVAIGYSRRITWIAFGCGILTGLMQLLCLPLVPMFFKLEPSVILDVQKILVVRALFSPLVTLNWTSIVGVLRSGGDTVAGMIFDLVPLWFVAIPLAFVGAFYFGLPIYVVVALTCMEEFVKLFLSVPRLLQNKWANNITVD